MGDTTEEILSREALRCRGDPPIFPNTSQRSQRGSNPEQAVSQLLQIQKQSTDIDGFKNTQILDSAHNTESSKDTRDSQSKKYSEMVVEPTVEPVPGVNGFQRDSLRHSSNRILEVLDRTRRSSYRPLKRLKSETGLSETLADDIPMLSLDIDLETDKDATSARKPLGLTELGKSLQGNNPIELSAPELLNSSENSTASIPRDTEKANISEKIGSLSNPELNSQKLLSSNTNTHTNRVCGRADSSGSFSQDQIDDMTFALESMEREIKNLRATLQFSEEKHSLEFESLKRKLHEEYSRQASQKLRQLYEHAQQKAQKRADSVFKNRIDDLEMQLWKERTEKEELVQACDEFLQLNGF